MNDGRMPKISIAYPPNRTAAPLQPLDCCVLQQLQCSATTNRLPVHKVPTCSSTDRGASIAR